MAAFKGLIMILYNTEISYKQLEFILDTNRISLLEMSQTFITL